MGQKTERMSDGMDYQGNSEKAGGPAPLVGRSPGAFAFSSPFGPRATLAPEGGPVSGGPAPSAPAAPAAPAAPSGNDPAPPADPAAPQAPAETAKAERPDYIPESFWDAEKGFKADDLNSLVAFKAEHDANLAQVPDKPEGYKVALPKDFKLPDGFKPPEGQESIIDDTDPRVADLRSFAHANQMSQTQFESMIALGAQMDIAEQGRLTEALAAQKELLGSKAVERVNAVTSWLGAKLGGNAAQALAPMMYTAKQVEAFEALMRLNRGTVQGNPGAGRDVGKTELSDEEYNRMSPSARINYARQNSKQ